TNAFVDTTVEPGQVFPWQNFAYFSYVTLTTLGFGDIQPVTLVARAAVTIESVIGVFYTTVIMARLVSLYTAQGVEAEIKHDHTQTG
ncbi:MAG: two pore domain potassium channel family protein, partial [Anaerolineae bacterium]|nr:two pore domain potassium channel family protein [Anaerolineae bacterium]